MRKPTKHSTVYCYHKAPRKREPPTIFPDQESDRWRRVVNFNAFKPELGGADPWRRLASAILLTAIKDANKTGNEQRDGEAEQAARWLRDDPLAELLLDSLSLDRRLVEAFLQDIGR